VNISLFLGKGDVYYRYGRYEDALRVYKEAYRIDPTDDDLLVQMGNVYRNTRQDAEALRIYDQILSQNPGHREAAISREFILQNRTLPD